MGCLLWATVTGGPPYQGAPAQVMLGHLQASVPQLTDERGRPGLNEVLTRTLAKRPEERFGSANELAVHLQALDLSGPAAGTSVVEPPAVMVAPTIVDPWAPHPWDPGTADADVDDGHTNRARESSAVSLAPPSDNHGLEPAGTARRRPGRTLVVSVSIAVLAASSIAALAWSPWQQEHDDTGSDSVAASVENDTIALDDLASATAGICVMQGADPKASPTSRAYAESAILQAWIGGLLKRRYAADHDLDVEPQDPGLESAPGWSDVDDRDRRALRAYVQAFVDGSAVEGEAGGNIDLSGYKVEINPRFDITFDGSLDGGAFVHSDGSPVAQDEAPSRSELAALPDDEVCGSTAGLRGDQAGNEGAGDEVGTRNDPVVRGDVSVVVFNNTSISGLGSTALARIADLGWNAVVADNWYGTIPATTVFYPAGLHRAATLLVDDLGVSRLQRAPSSMSDSSLTVILTGRLP